MKKIFLLVVLLAFSFLGFSQDALVLHNGKTINCKITKIDTAFIYATIYSNENEINSIFEKSKVREIIYGDLNESYPKTKSYAEGERLKNAITIGILDGGGSLIGFDIEMLLLQNIGIQVGGGLVGFGGGLNVHFKPSVKSSFISVQYWHQGFDKSFAQSLVGPSFVYRSKKWFTFQIGIGFALEKGPAWPSNTKQPEVMLTYAIGGYIPW